MYLVYILTCDSKSYVGMTNDFFRRWRQHIGDLQGGAKYTTRCGKDWYPICIIDGFATMREAMQCEWKLKRRQGSKGYRHKGTGARGRVEWLSHILAHDSRWTSKSPLIDEQSLTIYIDEEYNKNIPTRFPLQELYWRY
jgi:predicted GIY-YIG superfamily endonuclease